VQTNKPIDEVKAESYTTTRREINGTPVTVTGYRIGEMHYCHIENVEPGATIARASAATAENAESEAVAKAEKRLGGK
jgi:hypothetical protein